MDGNHGLHDSHDRGANALAEFQRDDAVPKVSLAPVDIGNEGAGRKGLGHALD